MAKKGSKKELSQRHEEYVAEAYTGQRSPSSGAAVTDAGDVRVASDNALIECKGKFGELTGKKAVSSTILSQFEKIADEAYSINKEPVLALRFYAPQSVLADNQGWVDLVIRLLDDDAHRAFLLATYMGANCGEEGRWH